MDKIVILGFSNNTGNKSTHGKNRASITRRKCKLYKIPYRQNRFKPGF